MRSELNSVCSVGYCSLHRGCTMAKAVSLRPLTAETRVRSRVSRCDKVKLGQFFSEYFGFPLSVHSTNAAYPSQSTCCPYQKDELANAGNFPKKQCASGNREALDGKAVSLLKCWSVTQLLDLASRCAPRLAARYASPVPFPPKVSLPSTPRAPPPCPAHPPATFWDR